MPAHDFEADEALAEGVKIQWLRSIKSLDTGEVLVEKMALEDGKPVPTGEFETLEADTVILALGQETDTAFLHAIPGIQFKKDGTVIVAPAAVQAEVPTAKVLKNGEKTTELGIGIEAVPMYNNVRGPEAGKLFHDKGRGNGYVLTVADKRVYLAGDTECTDEMKALQSIDVAFVCMTLPYTMPPAEAAQCVKAFKPKILYPYHYRDSDLAELTKGLDGEKTVEVRLRNWYP